MLDSIVQDFQFVFQKVCVWGGAVVILLFTSAPTKVLITRRAFIDSKNLKSLIQIGFI